MSVVDDRLRQLVQEMTDAAPPAGDLPDPGRPASGASGYGAGRGWLAPAASVVLVVVLGLGGAMWVRGGDVDGPTVASDGAVEGEDPGRSRGSDGGDVWEEGVGSDLTGTGFGELSEDGDGRFVLDPGEWVYPTYLPEGVDFEFAMASHGFQFLTFVNEAGHFGLRITVQPDYTPNESRTEGIGGTSWLRRVEFGGYLHNTTSGWLSVERGNLSNGELLEVIASLVVLTGDQLPRPPIDMEHGPFTEVARATHQGRDVTLKVVTDGTYYALEGGCCSALFDDDLLRITGGSGPGSPVPDPSVSGEGVIHGIVRESVARIDLHLVDGSVITTEPQDLGDSFSIDFVFVAIPVEGDDLFGQIETVVAYGVDGAELGRSREPGVPVISVDPDVAGADRPEVTYETVIVPEGLRLEELIDHLVAVNEEFDRDGFLLALQDPTLVSAYTDPAEPVRLRLDVRLEGTLFPAVYDVSLTDLDDEAGFLGRMVDQFDLRFELLLEEIGRDPVIDQLGLTDYQVIVVASLIEEEVAVAAQGPQMARVIYNRLLDGLPIQSDATAAYAAGKPTGGPLDIADLENESPWNTYVATGLPPTPIAAPGEDALRAALAPADGDPLFWVRTDAGGVEGALTFSSTVEEHSAAIEVCRERGLCG